MTHKVAPEVRDAEKRLPALAAALELPITKLSGEPQLVALGLGLRGWGLYRGFRHALKGPTLLTAHVDLRALLDTAILARWIQQSPELHVRLWFAEDQRERLHARDLFIQHLEMVKAVPDLWELYNVAYRHLSPVQHAGGRSFVRDSVHESAEGLFMKPGTPFGHAELRGLGVPSVCFVLATVSRQLGLGIEDECDHLRLSVVYPQT